MQEKLVVVVFLLTCKQLPPYYKYWKVYNNNNMKVSYRCMVDKQKNGVTHTLATLQKRVSSCRNSVRCSFQEKCLTNILCHANNLEQLRK